MTGGNIPSLSGLIEVLELSTQVMGEWIDAAELFIGPTVVEQRPSDDPQSLFDLAAHGCWARHPRETETDLERAVRQYNADNPNVRVGLDWGVLFDRAIRAGLFGVPPERDETTGPDTGDCSANGGGKWSDFMARLDEAIGEAA